MKPNHYNLSLNENEVIAIERALEFSKGNSTVPADRLSAFFSQEIGLAAHSAYKKVGKVHREIKMAYGKENKNGYEAAGRDEDD